MLEEKDFKKIGEEIGKVIEQNVLPAFNHLDSRINKIDDRMDRVESRLSKIEAEMVTKDYLDEKLSDLRGDLVVLVRKEDGKLMKLVEILQSKKVLADKEVVEILKLEPFAKAV